MSLREVFKQDETVAFTFKRTKRKSEYLPYVANNAHKAPLTTKLQRKQFTGWNRLQRQEGLRGRWWKAGTIPQSF